MADEISSFGKSKGDWYCPKCKYIIFGRKTHCKKCKTPKPEHKPEVKSNPEATLKLELEECRDRVVVNERSIRDFLERFQALGPVKDRELIFWFQYEGEMIRCVFCLVSEDGLQLRLGRNTSNRFVKPFAAHFEKFDIDQIIRFISKYGIIRKISATFGHYTIDNVCFQLKKAGLIDYDLYREDKRSGLNLMRISRIGTETFESSRSIAIREGMWPSSDQKNAIGEMYKSFKMVEYPSTEIFLHNESIIVQQFLE